MPCAHDALVLVRELELVGGVDLGVELDRLDRRAGQPERLRAIAALGGALDLQRARQRVGIVLQDDDAVRQDGERVRIEQDEAALQDAR